MWNLNKDKPFTAINIRGFMSVSKQKRGIQSQTLLFFAKIISTSTAFLKQAITEPFLPGQMEGAFKQVAFGSLCQ